VQVLCCKAPDVSRKYSAGRFAPPLEHESGSVTIAGHDCRTRSRRYLKPAFGRLRCTRRGCFVCFSYVVDALPEQCLRRRPGTSPLVALFLELSGYCLNVVQRHVYAANVLVRCGVDRDAFR
jgi:hypothetical protein